MIVAGIDIGSRAAKAVIMENDSILSSVICDTGPESVKTSYLAMQQALNKTNLSFDDIQHTVATGYGRVLVPYANENISEISCHARGINWYFPTVRTILDMGGQDCKAISCDGGGQVTNFAMNDKCAGGTGRFLEMIAEVLNIPLTKIGELSLRSKTAVPFNTICAVFAKSDAIAYLKKGVPKSDILAGLHEAIAERSFKLLKRVSIKKDFSITGGIAKNGAMASKLKEKVGLEPLLCEDPQIVGALGAALFAQERCERENIEKDIKVQYGYSDAMGDYFITIDGSRCDGCGECVRACPSGIFVVVDNDNGQLKAAVEEELRKKLAFLCPGFQACSSKHEVNCHSVCSKEAINHSW
ncbi:MAG: 4Fe-4S dicluster domain-containing protein [Dehalococcoidia bacterium]|nr:4Fe-4S dicluster domain-containing protein [Dehalococcoidia bacterium]